MEKQNSGTRKLIFLKDANARTKKKPMLIENEIIFISNKVPVIYQHLSFVSSLYRIKTIKYKGLRNASSFQAFDTPTTKSMFSKNPLMGS